MPFSVYTTLPEKIGEPELSEEIITLTGNVLNSYIMQDGLDMKKDEVILSRLMNASELFLRQFHRIIHFNETDHAGFRHWLNTLNPTLDEHAKRYQRIYKQIQHLANPPYFATSWSLAFLVDAVISVHPEAESLKDQNQETLSKIEYTTGFMDNLFQEFYSAMVIQRN